ncbi:MAG: DUF1957 domain-containing protein [Flexistipes sinusarabici]|uniref:DUF1957 domain-containing protein n=1 Tax=Flexistipes sinusarabici TaxID=2352 RepID=A0A5D0MJL6_FLESI|nr:1,4-alpha-glucan branching protein domain-containing protein [Flexistipes sinusarabici]TYB33176.1 MAG: DUF1957 domain-containing protein [Flexistipes sinusarabici]
MNGYWMLVLHSHLPFVKHPEYEYFLEEHWLYEAISECYLPLLMQLEKLNSERTNVKLVVSLTPTLCEMLADDMLKERFEKYLIKMIDLSKKEIVRTESQPEFNSTARFYKNRLENLLDYYRHNLNKNVLEGYIKFKNKGMLEIITCAATHGFLPFMGHFEKAVSAQITTAVNNYKKHFGENPKGIWLPECAYYHGLESVLNDYGIKYFFTDTHGVLFAKPRPRYGVYAPVYTRKGVAAFARDFHSSKQVWSSKEGYPGDYNYRDFYRDIGYDLDMNYIKPYISPDGARVFTGIKYHRITGKTDYKEPYIREKAIYKAGEHAAHFVNERTKQVDELTPLIDRKPLIVSPYDAELFGHWWFEGPEFLGNVFREMDKSEKIKPITPTEYLEEYETNQVTELNPSSWGDKGYYEVWLNSSNDWIYRHLNFAVKRIHDLAVEYSETSDPEEIRILNQMAREILLAQSSDWAFLMTTGTATEYAVKRTKEHIYNFLRLEKMLEGSVDQRFLSKCENKNSILQELTFNVYR